MFLIILTLLSALSISAVAIYYSIAGLAAIFAGAVIPIMVMGSVLEVGKLITASWLYQNWSHAPRLLKYYLSFAVFVLMFITSMGIFGFLSKAHIEQTSMSTEQIALIDTLDDKISRSNLKIDRWTGELDRLMKGEDVRVDNLIAQEQQVLDGIYTKIKQEKDDIRVDFDKQIELQNNRLKQAQERKEADIAAAQERYKTAFSKKGLDEAIAQAKANELSVASAVQKEILQINNALNDTLAGVDSKYADEITDIQNRIQDLRNQANTKTQDIDVRISELETFIDTEQTAIDGVREEKFLYEKEYRKLEAEVGPIKYIAEFIYGETADQTLLEEAVRWVIIIIIVVFDPLAVLMLIAANYSIKRKYGKTLEDYADSSFKSKRSDIKKMKQDLARFNELKEHEDHFKEYEQARAEKIDANEPPEFDNTPMTEEEEYRNAGISKKEIQELKEKEFEKREEEWKESLEEISKQARDEDNEKPDNPEQSELFEKSSINLDDVKKKD